MSKTDTLTFIIIFLLFQSVSISFAQNQPSPDTWKIHYDSALYIGSLWDGYVDTEQDDIYFWSEYAQITLADMAAFQLYEKNPETDTAFITVLKLFAEICKKDIQYDCTGRNIFQLAEIHKSRYGEDSEYARLLIESSDYYVMSTPMIRSRDIYDKVKKNYDLAIEILEDQEKPDIREIFNLKYQAIQYSIFGAKHDNIQRRRENTYQKAESDLKHLTKVYEKTAILPVALTYLGKYYMDIGNLRRHKRINLREAKRYFSQARENFSAQQITNSVDYAILLSYRAEIFQIEGNYSMAENLYKKAASKINENLSDYEQDYIYTLSNLSDLYYEIGDYEKAEALMIRVTEYYQKVPFKDLRPRLENLKEADALIKLGRLYLNMGRYSEAKRLFFRAERIKSHALGNAHIETTIARVYLKESIEGKVSEKDLELLKQNKSSYSMEYARALDVVGKYHLKQGNRLRSNYEKAELFFKQSLVIKRSSLPSIHYEIARTISMLGELYFEAQEYDKAEKLFEDAAEITENSLGNAHPFYARYIKSLAFLNWSADSLDKADKYFNLGSKLFKEQINTYFTFLSEIEKEQFYYSIKDFFEAFNAYAIERASQNPNILSELYNNQLAVKALMLDASNKIKNRIFQSGDTALINIYNDWLATREILATISGMRKDQLTFIDIDSLRKKQNKLEKELSLKSQAFEGKSESLRWEDIQRKLKKKEAAIEIIRIRQYNTLGKPKPTTKSLYACLVVKRSTKNHPELVIIPDGNRLENEYLNAYRNHIKYKVVDSVSYQNFWKPLESELKKIKKIYFSPDGVYNQINLNTLFNYTSEKYLIEEINIKQVTNTRDILASALSSKNNKSAILVGFPTYDLSKRKIEEQLVGHQYTLVRQQYVLNLERGMSLESLPGTKVEIEGISNILENEGWESTILMEENAVEENVKNVNNPVILHISTHGFFEQDVVDGEKNPYLRSGLMLTGAANSLRNESNLIEKIFTDEGIEDGILTAYEAMNLNLDKTELVVLSACETGLGEIRNGEGVYGLQRAFIVAGAQAIIMSLWKVNDKTTQELMTLFYVHYAKTKDRSTAFKHAQIKLKQKYPEPYYWGAFLMIGD